mmetsp:Transcript_10132/g.30026  ORF Transcript_10132/g.30026 Transcript_10132/m.30026 type:complete len:332 (+) Transcript_10132:1-996(+)
MAAGLEEGLATWLPEYQLHVLGFLQPASAGALLATCADAARRLRRPVAAARQASRDAASAEAWRIGLQAQQAFASLEAALTQAPEVTGTSTTETDEKGRPTGMASTWQNAWDRLLVLEGDLRVETRYLYGPDWEVKAGKMISKKGTWLKRDTRFSWELQGTEKLYLPQGIVMPVLQISKVVDRRELRRHEWVSQHLRVWLKPAIIKSLEARRNAWFVYWPHFEDRGNTILAVMDTWLKKSAQMSGELQPFELVYVPKGASLELACYAETVDEEWEKFRHQHVHLHRKVTLTAPPLTVKQEGGTRQEDNYDVFIGQGEARETKSRHSGARMS